MKACLPVEFQMPIGEILSPILLQLVPTDSHNAITNHTWQINCLLYILMTI